MNFQAIHGIYTHLKVQFQLNKCSILIDICRYMLTEKETESILLEQQCSSYTRWYSVLSSIRHMKCTQTVFSQICQIPGWCDVFLRCLSFPREVLPSLFVKVNWRVSRPKEPIIVQNSNSFNLLATTFYLKTYKNSTEEFQVVILKNICFW